MSDDLISRKAILELLTSCNFGNASIVCDSDGFPTHISIVGIIKIISTQPTAYDREKVLEELRQNRSIAEAEYKVAGEYGDDGSFLLGKVMAYEIAIAIVEKGGIE